MPLTLLLNPRAWALAAIAAILAYGGYECVQFGRNSVQVEFDAYKNQQTLDTLAAVQAARTKEQTLQAANQKVSKNYESLKSATATAVGALDADRLRLQDSLGGAAALTAEAAARADDLTRARYVVGQCTKAIQRLAAIADTTEDRLIGLQDYVNKVVQP